MPAKVTNTTFCPNFANGVCLTSHFGEAAVT
jgi:hypothetical protein